MLARRFALAIAALVALFATPVFSAEVIPHAQDKPPGPALSPREAMEKMKLPQGFAPELVASEPDIVNPVAMTFDERGRIWITESLEYPRREPGPGRDRIKILEDTDGDGRADKFTIFAEGLNIPSGIAVGHGGVWVANSPDILFLQDTDGDGRADKQEVVITGFGRDDTHELPNSLTWGPDGWLYGLNGVFNPAHVEYRGKKYDFTCALFRIHPKTRDFELFAEGTSNPWGVAWDTEGSAFLSACVIDHLWHLTETGYYVRQGGPYPPFTSVIGSIVKHKHQKAAYCGIHYYDSDAYPEQFRGKLYMGNIHGNCINCDVLERDGATYFAKPDPDFLTANDAWFMPVSQKTGPDGSLYILDWYDRYHCYQDANRDPMGIDRLKGRLYRIRYKDTPRAASFDLAKESDDQLIDRLKGANGYFRDIAQRLLAERANAENRKKLEHIVVDDSVSRKARMHALWALIGGGPLDVELHQKLLAHDDPGFRAWGVRAAGNQHKVDPAIREKVLALAVDTSPDVRVQVAIAARKLEDVPTVAVLLDILSASADDKLIPHIVWQNLSPLMDDHGDEVLEAISKADAKQSWTAWLMPKLIDRVVGGRSENPAPIVRLVKLLVEKGSDPAGSQKALAALSAKVQSREISGARLESVRGELQALIQKVLADSADKPLYLDAALLATSWRDPAGIAAARNVYLSDRATQPRRVQALEALVSAADPSLERAVSATLSAHQRQPVEIRAATLGALGRLDQKWVATVVLANYKSMEPALQPRAIELLTQRKAWSLDLLEAIGRGDVPTAALNVNQVQKLLASKDEKIIELVKARWGSLRTTRDPKREQVIAEMRTLIRRTPGDPHRGEQVFEKLCGQCHKIYGKGQDVGPDITVNGRSSFEQLLSNVFDPSLVIGAAYQARTILTSDGRVLTGLLAEEGDQRVVLKIQGGKLETIARDEIEEMKVSELSLMPEDIEKQFKEQEVADLFAYITLDKPPGDPTARQLPGVRVPAPIETRDRSKFPEIVAQVAPGFTTSDCGEEGLAILAEYRGRPGVLRTHPVDRSKACVLSSGIDVPEGKKTQLYLTVGHHEQGDWQLIVKANGTTVHDSIVGPDTSHDGWRDVTVDLSSLAGKRVELELLNKATGWSYEYGYWARAEVISQ
jgi:putative membrane-bound dehydrogenase-like protein